MRPCRTVIWWAIFSRNYGENSLSIQPAPYPARQSRRRGRVGHPPDEVPRGCPPFVQSELSDRQTAADGLGIVQEAVDPFDKLVALGQAAPPIGHVGRLPLNDRVRSLVRPPLRVGRVRKTLGYVAPRRVK